MYVQCRLITFNFSLFWSHQPVIILVYKGITIKRDSFISQLDCSAHFLEIVTFQDGVSVFQV